MNQKRYLRSNERLAVITDAKVLETAAGHQLCLTLEVLAEMSDRIDINHVDAQHVEAGMQALKGLGQALGLRSVRDTSQLIGKEVIVALDERGDLESYHPPLASKEG